MSVVYLSERVRLKRFRRASALASIPRGVAQPGSAPALGAGGRRFESARPDGYDAGMYACATS